MFSIITGALELVGSVFSGYQAKQKAKLAIQLAEMENKARLLRDEQSNNHAWEMAALTDKDKWLRRASFIMFASPFFVAIFAPHHVEVYFNTAIKSVPMWWQQTFMAITGGIWGISSLKHVLPAVINTIFKKGK